MELSFDPAPTGEPAPEANNDGLSAWRAERARANEELGRRLGLPVNHGAEIRLGQGIVLRGILRLAEETLWIEATRHTLLLRIDSLTFRFGEIESAIRTDLPGDGGGKEA
ncbi:MAG: hypothetical protein ABI680_00765 [Chthoniobacteraceae bacterium]